MEIQAYPDIAKPANDNLSFGEIINITTSAALFLFFAFAVSVIAINYFAFPECGSSKTAPCYLVGGILK